MNSPKTTEDNQQNDKTLGQRSVRDLEQIWLKQHYDFLFKLSSKTFLPKLQVFS